MRTRSLMLHLSSAVTTKDYVVYSNGSHTHTHILTKTHALIAAYGTNDAIRYAHLIPPFMRAVLVLKNNQLCVSMCVPVIRCAAVCGHTHTHTHGYSWNMIHRPRAMVVFLLSFAYIHIFILARRVARALQHTHNTITSLIRV